MSFRFRLQNEDDPCYYDSRSLTDLWKGDRDERSGSECKFWKWWWSLSMVTSNFVLVLDDSRILGSLCGLLSHGCLIYGQFHGAQSNFDFFQIKFCTRWNLTDRKLKQWAVWNYWDLVRLVHLCCQEIQRICPSLYLEFWEGNFKQSFNI